MSKYLVRIELHQPTVKDPYERLHEIMEKAGFKRTIVTDGVEYHLPDAEYIGISDLELLPLRDAVKVLAAQVHAGVKASIFVVPFTAYAWSGLKPVKPQPEKDYKTLLRELLAEPTKK